MTCAFMKVSAENARGDQFLDDNQPSLHSNTPLDRKPLSLLPQIQHLPIVCLRIPFVFSLLPCYVNMLIF